MYNKFWCLRLGFGIRGHCLEGIRAKVVHLNKQGGNFYMKKFLQFGNLLSIGEQQSTAALRARLPGCNTGLATSH